MNIIHQHLIPPAPQVHVKDLPLWRLMRNVIQSSLSVWPDYAFDVSVSRKRLLGVDTLLINDPEGIRHVLSSNAANYRRPMPIIRVVRPLIGSGVFLAEGEEWRRQRKILSPSFTPSSTNLLLPHFHDAAEHLLRAVAGRCEVNLSQAFQDTALEAVLRALFSKPESSLRDHLSGMIRAYAAGSGRPALLDGFAKSETAFAFAARGRRRFQAEWLGAIEAVVSERKASRNAGAAKDLLDQLLEIRDADTGEALSDEDVRDQCGTMFFGGSETTARMMFWASYLLAQDTQTQSLLRAEIGAFAPERVAKMEDLQNWPLLRNVLLEAMRLYPPVPHILREAVGPDTVCGEAIAVGAQIWVSPWVMHRHRKFWEHPTAFIPTRFAGKPAPWVQTPGYIPFGAGPRICMGLHFALAEAQIVLAHLLSRYRISLPGAEKVMPIGRVTTEPSVEPGFGLEAVG
jgi:cytochrome P450